MRSVYLLGKVIQASIFTILLLLIQKRRSLEFAILSFVLFLIGNLIVDFIYGRMIESKIKEVSNQNNDLYNKRM